jgi:hypothetical protein
MSYNKGVDTSKVYNINECQTLGSFINMSSSHITSGVEIISVR